MAAFSEGDVVVLKSGSPPLTVSGSDDKVLNVTYFNKVSGLLESKIVGTKMVRFYSNDKPTDVYPTGGPAFNSSLNR